jgi:hypothetical protein
MLLTRWAGVDYPAEFAARAGRTVLRPCRTVLEEKLGSVPRAPGRHVFLHELSTGSEESAPSA